MDLLGSTYSPNGSFNINEIRKSHSNSFNSIQSSSFNESLDNNTNITTKLNENRIKYKLMKSNIINSIMYGLVNSILCIPVCMSFASIIFRDSFFYSYLPSLIKLVTASCVIHQCIFSCQSSLSFAIGQVQDAGLIFLSTMASNIVFSLQSNRVPSEEIIVTTLFTLSFSTFLLGVALIITGKLKLAKYVQYLPMPVIGGYLAYIGFFCFESSLSLMSGKEIKKFYDIYYIFNNVTSILYVLPGLIAGIILYFIPFYFKHYIAIPTAIGMILIIFYLFVIVIFNISLDTLRENAWLDKIPISSPTILQIYKLYDFKLIHWSIIPKQLFIWLGMYFVVAFSSSLDVAAIEMNLVQSLDYNHEIKTVGLSNTISGLMGGFTGSYIFSQTIFTMRSGTNSRLIGIVVILCEFMVLFIPFSITSYIPKFFFGSLLTFIGFDLMMEWIIYVKKKIHLREYSIVWCTFISINLMGIEIGMLLGIIFSILNFIYSYSISTFVIPKTSKSYVLRDHKERKILSLKKNEIVTLELHGFLFFGSSIRLYEEIKKSIESSIHHTSKLINHNERMEKLPLLNKEKDSTILKEKYLSPYFNVNTQYLVLDFTYVNGLDTTATRICFNGIQNILQQNNMIFVFTNVSNQVKRQLIMNQIILEGPINYENKNILVFNKNYEGIEWCENDILQNYYKKKLNHNIKIQIDNDILNKKSNENYELLYFFAKYLKIKEEKEMSVINMYFQSLHLKKSNYLFSIGDKVNEIFYILNGSVELSYSIQSNNMDSNESVESKRFIKINKGNIIGEIDFFNNKNKRIFNCITMEECDFLVINRKNYNELEKNHLHYYINLQQSFLKAMANRIHIHMP